MALPTDEDAVAANSVDSDSRENRETAGASLLAGSTAENPENQPIRLRITSALENAGDGGVAVPDIRLLSQGTHRRFFATPKRLTNNPVTWQTQNARILDAAQIPFDVQATTPTHVFYEVVGETFTANLQPNSGGAEAARIPLVELDLFPENTATAIGLMRVHLIPGDRDTLPVELPPDAEPLGAWAGGIPVEMRRFEDGRLEIPVGISRLVQPMTLLVRLAVPADEASDVLIPRITAIPVSTTWCARYDDRSHRLGRVIIEEPADDSPQSFAEVPAASLREARELLESAAPSGTWQTVGVSTYRQQLAESIADLLDSVADSVSERPSSEKQFWLRPWFARLQQLRWASLDDWAPRLMQRVFGSEATSMDGLALAGLPQSMVSPAGWIPTRVVRQTGPASAIPRGLIPQQSNPLERWAGVALSAAIALGFCITILVMRWLFRIDLTLRPHLWLGLVGLALLTLLPSPVGLTAITLSMVLALIERWR
jgi:hypothetical protein